MTVLAERARFLFRRVRRTPLHPQWLYPDDLASEPDFLQTAQGLVLDVGCADRWVEEHLPAGCRYIGLDYPATGLILYGARPDILADAARLPLADESVDTILLLDVMEHLRFPQPALMESARVLRSGARLLVSVPFLYPIHVAPHDYQRTTLHGLTRDMEEAGLRLEWIRPSAGSAETAALLMCLALAGAAHQAWVTRSAALIVVPFFLALVPLINVFGWLAGKLLPSWPALTTGYRLVAIKP